MRIAYKQYYAHKHELVYFAW